MRLSAVFLVSLMMADLAWSQVTEVPSTHTKQELPMYRPVLLGQGQSSLVNRIDTQELMRKGQKNSWVRFISAVSGNGDVMWSQIFGSAPDSDLLKEELGKRLSAAADPRFVPAIYNHKPVAAIYYGTLTFAVVNGRPRLRIFSNQEPKEVEAENDFIGPQPFFGDGSTFTGFHYPNETARVVVDGMVRVHLKIDAAGNRVVGEIVSAEPPFEGFEEAALQDFLAAQFIPAFRNGQPVACDVILPVLYKAKAF
jgi:TonB family protein